MHTAHVHDQQLVRSTDSLHSGPRGQAAIALPRMYMAVAAANPPPASANAGALSPQAAEMLADTLAALLATVAGEPERGVATSALQALAELFEALPAGVALPITPQFGEALCGALRAPYPVSEAVYRSKKHR